MACRTLLQFLARPTLFFYALPWLMVLLVAGTVAQREIGLYRAEKIFFSAPLVWLGPIPLPGTVTVLGVIAVSLMAKLLLKSPWRRDMIGNLLTHASMLVLLGGGLVSNLGREEGYLELAVGATGAVVSDYHDRALAVVKNGVTLLTVPEDDLVTPASIYHPAMPFKIMPRTYCRNCAPEARPKAQTGATPPSGKLPGEEFRGAAASMILTPAPLMTQDEDNRAGVTFVVSGAGAERDGIYITYDGLKQMPSFAVDSDRYEIAMRRAERALPFAVTLLEFNKSNHPGTDVARAYAATVEVQDGGARWRTEISMNTPLRYRGYTLYQASFIDRAGALSSVLTVVRDRGQVFPYLAGALFCLGMGMHLVQRGRQQRKAGAA
ncbi:MAG: cytochrome c biogenesis protein ResB [Alphaproteobacteria bacterium]